MSTIRIKRVESLLKEKICNIILKNELKDPRIDKLLSVTDITVSRDIKHAKVYISYYGKQERTIEMVNILNHAAGFIQNKLGKQLHIKTIPRLRFIYDDSLERGFRITKKLRELHHYKNETASISGGS